MEAAQLIESAVLPKGYMQIQDPRYRAGDNLEVAFRTVPSNDNSSSETSYHMRQQPFALSQLQRTILAYRVGVAVITPPQLI